MTAALILIDVQKGLDEPSLGQRNNPDAEVNMRQLLDAWRHKAWPVIHVKHNSAQAVSPLRPDLPGNAIKDIVMPLPGEPLMEKTVNSAFIGTDLEAQLHAQRVQRLVMVGLITDHCVSTSVRMAANLGFDVWLVADATATFDRTSFDGRYWSAEQMHAVSLASLHGEFCTVVNTRSLVCANGTIADKPFRNG